MKLARQNYAGLQSQFNIFYSVCQSVNHSIAAHMFEYFVRPHVCLSVSPAIHSKHVTCVDAVFISSLVLGGRDKGKAIGGGGSVSLKLSFAGG